MHRRCSPGYVVRFLLFARGLGHSTTGTENPRVGGSIPPLALFSLGHVPESNAGPTPTGLGTGVHTLSRAPYRVLRVQLPPTPSPRATPRPSIDAGVEVDAGPGPTER
jgi:hypothetical protein